jgi:hypothetical protein
MKNSNGKILFFLFFPKNNRIAQEFACVKPGKTGNTSLEPNKQEVSK